MYSYRLSVNWFNLLTYRRVYINYFHISYSIWAYQAFYIFFYSLIKLLYSVFINTVSWYNLYLFNYFTCSYVDLLLIYIFFPIIGTFTRVYKKDVNYCANGELEWKRKVITRANFIYGFRTTFSVNSNASLNGINHFILVKMKCCVSFVAQAKLLNMANFRFEGLIITFHIKPYLMSVS